MKRFAWPRVTAPAVTLVPPDHPNITRVVAQILDHARAGRGAFLVKRFTEAKYHRDCCSLLIWRLAVDGITADGQIRWDAAKYETRLPGRFSSAAARDIRESPVFKHRGQSALENHVVCDHIVPRNCVAEALVRPDWWDTDDLGAGREFVLTHAEVAIISPDEDAALAEAFEARMPEDWWNAPLAEKGRHKLGRYAAVDPEIVVTAYGT